MAQVAQSGVPINLTSSGTVSKADGSLLGFYVNNTSAGTVVVRSGSAGTSAGTAVSGTITPAIGWHSFPAYCPGGCFITISGTIDLTAFFAAG